jgi:hypothetical protein
MTINNPEAFCASLWDWGCLDGCFGETRIKPTDLDGLIERHGKFLAIETKLPGVSIPQGQDIILRALAGTGYFTVLVVWGKPGVPERASLWHAGNTHEYDTCNLARLRDIVSRWFRWADSSATTTRT